MKPLRLVLSIAVIFFLSTYLVAQSHISKPGAPRGMASGTSWAQQAMAALTGGNSVNSVTESGSVSRTVGEDQESGTITLQSSGIMTSQISISTSVGNRSETRIWQNGRPSGSWIGLDGVQYPMAQQNCWNDAVWFFPALSLLADYADPNLVFTDLGQGQLNGNVVEHIEVNRVLTDLPPVVQQVIQDLSAVDYYLDSQTALPVGISFSVHGDHDLSADVPVTIVFSNYQAVSGIQVPFQVTQLLNGSPYLQVSITSAAPSGQGSLIHK